MAKVSDAMKKHQAEQAEKPPAPEAKPKQPTSAAAVAVAQGAAAPAAPLEAAAPAVGGDGCSPLLLAYHDRGGAITEEYRALRTNLLAQCPRDKFCYVVTSALPGEGKTVTCLNLGVVMAERPDRRTVVVDGDLRKAKCAKLLNVSQSPGVGDILQGLATIKDALQPSLLPNLFFIPAGMVRQNEVGKLMGRPELEEMVNQLRRQFDHVIFDSPPINVASDAGMLGRATGEALLVVRMNKTNKESVQRAVALLQAADVKPVGVVLTHQKFHIPGYLYRYS